MMARHDTYCTVDVDDLAHAWIVCRQGRGGSFNGIVLCSLEIVYSYWFGRGRYSE